MPDEVRCPGCGHRRDDHEVPPGEGWADEYSCTLTPAEIDAVLAMRANNLAVPVESRADTRNSGWSIAPAGDGKKPGPTPLVYCEGCGIVRVAAIVNETDTCPKCGVVGRKSVAL